MKGSRPDRMRVYGPGLRKKPRALALVSTRHSAPQFPLHPYIARKVRADRDEGVAGGAGVHEGLTGGAAGGGLGSGVPSGSSAASFSLMHAAIHALSLIHI